MDYIKLRFRLRCDRIHLEKKKKKSARQKKTIWNAELELSPNVRDHKLSGFRSRDYNELVVSLGIFKNET